MILEYEPDISVIIPVYNGALYLEDTIKSLLNQSFRKFEIICVDDGSTDNSLDILNRLANNDSRIKIYNKLNSGNANKALIYGLKFAIGKYFMYSSQDDLFSKDLLEKNHKKALDCNADVVLPDLEYYWSDIKCVNRPPGIYGVRGDRGGELTGRQALVLSLDWTIHGFALWNMDTVRNIGFFDYGLSSDEYSTRLFFFASKKIVFSDGVFYYRQDNPHAITKKWNISQLDYIITYKKLENFLIINNFTDNELVPVYKKLFSELIRIQVLFNHGARGLSHNEFLHATRLLKSAYFSIYGNINKLELRGLKGKIKSYIFGNYRTFVIYCKYIQLKECILKFRMKIYYVFI